MSDNTVPLQMLGDPTAVSCEGDTCEISEHHGRMIVNRLLDSDQV